MAKISILPRPIKEQGVVPEPPADWTGSRPEWAIYWALLNMGKKDGIDFIYQSSRMGGRLSKGGVVIDFLFLDPPNLAINVISRYYHYATTPQRTADELQRALLEGQGLKVIFIDETDALRNPKYYVQDALNGIDHSVYGR